MILCKPLARRLSWPAALAVAMVSVLMVPAVPRCAAQQPREQQDNPGTGNLDRRMLTLEKQMQEVLRLLEAEAKARQANRPSIAAEEMKKLEERKTQYDQAMEWETKEAKAKKRAAGEAKKEIIILDQAKGKDTPSKVRLRTLFPGDGLTAEQMKELHEQIEAAVKEAINPERMKEIQRRVQEAVGEGVKPERAEAMQKHIEQTLRNVFDAKRAEAISHQIEAAVRGDLKTPQPPESRQRGPGPGGPMAPGPGGPAGLGGGGPGPGGFPGGLGGGMGMGIRDQEARELEQRLDKLEKKMDRLLEVLESSRKR